MLESTKDKCCGGIGYRNIWGLFTSAAAFVNTPDTSSSLGISHGFYLQCEEASAVDKFITIFLM